MSVVSVKQAESNWCIYHRVIFVNKLNIIMMIVHGYVRNVIAVWWPSVAMRCMCSVDDGYYRLIMKQAAFISSSIQLDSMVDCQCKQIALVHSADRQTDK